MTLWTYTNLTDMTRQRGLGKLTSIEFETIFEVAHAA